MAIPTLSGSYIDETYIRLVQVSGSEFSDGLGNTISFGPGSLSGGIDGYIPIWSGSVALSNSIISQTRNLLNVSGSISASNGITASLEGTASWAYNVVNPTNIDTSTLATTGSNVFSGSQTITGSLTVTNEFTLDETLTKFAKYTNTGVGVANNVTLFSIATGSYTSAFGKYTIYSGSNSRAGELMTSRNDTTINYTDVATNDIGSTSMVKLISQVSESYYQIIASFPATGTWDIKMMATYI